jgi:hypothetical protein
LLLNNIAAQRGHLAVPPAGTGRMRYNRSQSWQRINGARPLSAAAVEAGGISASIDMPIFCHDPRSLEELIGKTLGVQYGRRTSSLSFGSAAPCQQHQERVRKPL